MRAAIDSWGTLAYTLFAASAVFAGCDPSVTDTPKPSNSVAIELDSLALSVGTDVTVSATALNADGAPIPGANIEWSTLDVGIATVDDHGRLSGAAPGATRLIARHGDAADTAIVTVYDEIAFVSNRGGDADIYVVTADGNGGLNLTGLTGAEVGPAWSPAGDRLAFLGYGSAGNHRVAVVGADGTGLVTLTTDAWYWAPTWSSDGARIAYIHPGTGGDLYVMNADGTGATPLSMDDRIDTEPVWSPVEPRIAFTSSEDGNTEIRVINADGTGEVNLTNSHGEDDSPRWSPDGQRIAFSSSRDGNREIYVMYSDGSGLLNLTSDPGTDHSPAWSPDGTRIAFSSFRDGNFEIYVINADGSGLQNLTANPAQDSGPAAWSPDGGRIAFTSDRDGNEELYVMNADGTGPVRLTNAAGNDRSPVWRP